jgi:hypothetical protein
MKEIMELSTKVNARIREYSNNSITFLRASPI